MQAQVHTNPEKIEAQAQRLKHLITVLAFMFLSDCINSYSCMLALLEKTRLMGLYSSSLQFEFYQNGHITRYSISGCHLQYGIFLGRAWYNTCMSLEGGREGKIQHVKKDVCLLRLKIMVAVLATCFKRQWNSTPLPHSSVCFIILMGMVQEGCTCTCTCTM